MSGVIAVHTSWVSPACRPTSLVASPSKNRPTGPNSTIAVDGKNDRDGLSVATCSPSRFTSSTDPKFTFSRRPSEVVVMLDVGRT